MLCNNSHLPTNKHQWRNVVNADVQNHIVLRRQVLHGQNFIRHWDYCDEPEQPHINRVGCYVSMHHTSNWLHPFRPWGSIFMPGTKMVEYKNGHRYIWLKYLQWKLQTVPQTMIQTSTNPPNWLKISQDLKEYYSHIHSSSFSFFLLSPTHLLIL